MRLSLRQKIPSGKLLWRGRSHQVRSVYNKVQQTLCTPGTPALPQKYQIQPQLKATWNYNSFYTYTLICVWTNRVYIGTKNIPYFESECAFGSLLDVSIPHATPNINSCIHKRTHTHPPKKRQVFSGIFHCLYYAQQIRNFGFALWG